MFSFPGNVCTSSALASLRAKFSTKIVDDVNRQRSQKKRKRDYPLSGIARLTRLSLLVFSCFSKSFYAKYRDGMCLFTRGALMYRQKRPTGRVRSRKGEDPCDPRCPRLRLCLVHLGVSGLRPYPLSSVSPVHRRPSSVVRPTSSVRRRSSSDVASSTAVLAQAPSLRGVSPVAS